MGHIAQQDLSEYKIEQGDLDVRDAFFTTLPINVMYGSLSNPNFQEQLAQARFGIHQYHLGGQVGNDLQDFFTKVGSNKRFSDMRNGLATVPIRMLWERLSEDEKQVYSGLFGRLLAPEEGKYVQQLIDSHGIVDRTLRLIHHMYEGFHRNVDELVPNERKLILTALTDHQFGKFAKLVE